MIHRQLDKASRIKYLEVYEDRWSTTMARFPKIQKPCPVANSLDEYMDGDHCRLCKRNVVDIGDMSDAERRNFLDNCAGETCVTYSIRLKHVAAAVALSATAASLPVAAQESPLEALGLDPAAQQELPRCAEEFEEIDVILVGGIKHRDEREYIDTPDDQLIPELPVTYETANGGDTDAPTHTSDVDTSEQARHERS
jgi:hypothetical protein